MSLNNEENIYQLQFLEFSATSFRRIEQRRRFY